MASGRTGCLAVFGHHQQVMKAEGTAWDNRCSGGPSPTMTVRADRLTKRAKTPDQAGSVRSSYPAGSVRVFVDALERLDYCMEPLLANAGIRRADLDDPDARIPRPVWGQLCAERWNSVR